MKLKFKLKQILASVLSVGMAFSASMPVFAAEPAEPPAQPASVSVTLSMEQDNYYPVAPAEVTVSGDLSDRYGYTDTVEGVSVLDGLIAAHEIMFAEAFTPETKGDFLVVSDEGFISTMMGEETTAVGFAVNGMMPHNGVVDKVYGTYTAYTANQAELADNDVLQFFFYNPDGYYGEIYTNFLQGTEHVTDITATAGEDIALALKGYSFIYEGCNSEIKWKDVSDIQIAVFEADSETTGALVPVEGVVTAEDGTFTVNFAEPGTYYLGALSDPEMATFILPQLCKVTVEPAEWNLVMDGELFTLGQGYFLDPMDVKFTQGETVADILLRVLADAGIEETHTGEGNTFYLSKLKGIDKGFNCLPAYLSAMLEANNLTLAPNEDEWLGEKDYTSMSGWMYTVNNEMAQVGMGAYTPADGDVVRVHFTTAGFGADLGFGWGEGGAVMADKDAMTALLAEITEADLAKKAFGTAIKANFPEAATVGDVVAVMTSPNRDTETAPWLAGDAAVCGVTQEVLDAVAAELRTCLTFVPEVPGTDAELPEADPAIPENFESDIWLQYDFMKLDVGKTADIYPRRVPQIISDAVGNDVARPNFNFEIVSGDSITLSTADSTDKTVVTAVKPGVSIVKVTADALDYKNMHFDETAATNAAYAVFAVSGSTVDTGITIQSAMEIQPGLPLTSYDTIYYSEGDTVNFAYAPEVTGADTVRVTCNGHVIEAENGVYNLPLENRSNIIGVTASNELGVEYYYQVVDARKITVNIANKTRPGEPFQVGDTAVVSFTGIANPVYKLATIYNPTWYKPDSPWGPTYGTYVEYTNKELSDKPFLGICGQYDLATNNDFEVVLSKPGTFAFTDGKISSEWWGSKLGTDKGVYGQGDPNLNAPVMHRYFCDMPDFSLLVRTKEEIAALNEAKKNAKLGLEAYPNKEYFNADGLKAFDEILKEASAAIDAAESVDEVKAAVAAATAKLDNIPTFVPQSNISVAKPLDGALYYLYSHTPDPTIGTFAGEWTVMALSGGKYDAADNYYEKYYDNVVKILKENKGVLSGDRKYTEYSRVIMGLASIGKDATDVGGYNLVEKLANYKKVTRQGINGPIFALIALDTRGYETSDPDIRQKYVDYILGKEIKGGGFALFGDKADPDITGMALQGLANYKDQPAVAEAIDRAVKALSKMQDKSGCMPGWGSVSSESISQTVIALCALGINPQTDDRFVKNGNSLLEALLTFEAKGGGFMHVYAGAQTGGGSDGGKADPMATDQAALALVAYTRLRAGEGPLYDYSDKAEPSVPGGAGGAGGSKEPALPETDPVKEYPSQDGKGTWTQYENGAWALRDAEGKSLTGWQKVDGKWYHFAETGIMNTGKLVLNEKTYFLAENGAMKTGWFLVDNTWYYAAADGAVQEQKALDTNPVHKYTAADKTGDWTKYADGTWSFTKADGTLATGWNKVDGEWYFMSGTGVMQTGWQLINGSWFYLAENGKMATGWQKINGSWFYLKSWGGMTTGWMQIGGSWYYFKDWGGMAVGWAEVNGGWYYLTESGKMLANTTTPDNYKVDASGRMI